MAKPGVFVPAEARVKEVLDLLLARRISSAFVGEPTRGTGIATERDLLRAIGRTAPPRSTCPSARSPPGRSLACRRRLSSTRAIGRMSARGIRHLAAFSESGEIVGAVSARDLLRLRASAAIELGDDVDQAKDVPALARAWAKVPSTAVVFSRRT
jgi:DNA polymerase-3 subunit epsilon/CBS domain-containing protein